MLKAYKYRIYPKEQQRQLIEQTIGCCRLVYNLALEVKMVSYKEHGVTLSYFDLCHQLVDLKQDYEWLHQVDSHALQAAVKKVDVAFKNFYNGNGYPKFKSKHGKQSFQCPTHKRQVDFEKQFLTIPKISDIPIAVSRTFVGKIKTVTISRTSTGKYFASVLVDNGKELPKKKQPQSETAVGIDLGIKDFAILSDGTKVINPKYFKNNLQRLKVLQRRLSRKKKGSANRKKAVMAVAIQHERIANMRKDFLHKTSTAIAKQYDTLCVENLSIGNMVRNHKLAQAISDAGWDEFIRQCKYKMDWKGGNVLELPKFQASTKPCSDCGAINSTLTLADREWTCAECGSLHDRDINAAINIKNYFFKESSAMGSRVESVELPSIDGAKKQKKLPSCRADFLKPKVNEI